MKNKIFPKIKSWFEKASKLKVSKKSLLIIIPVILVVVFAGTFLLTAKNLFSSHEELDQSFILLTDSHQKKLTAVLGDIPELKDKTNPINGTKITSTRRDELDNKKVFAVTVNNHPKARPQSGLGQADMVMEVLTEGGITRYVALFYDNQPEKIGPVRSLRRYMIDFIAEYDSPVILHEGWAGFNDADEVYVRETDAITDVYTFGMKSMQSAQSRYRDNEKALQSGYVHSLYTSYKLIADDFVRLSASLGWDSTSNIQELKWKEEALVENRGDYGSVKFTFLGLSSSISESGFTYNKDTNSYDRFIAGADDIDNLTDEIISPKNVVIEWHNYRPANDGYARIIIDMVGEGETTILRDGKQIEGTWKKSDRTDRTKYYDENGMEIELNRGQIWKVMLVKSGNQKVSTVEYNY